MNQARQGNQRRRGSATVEMAVVSVVFLLFLFGILEYCRFMYIRQIIFNAAREGARYAVVNTTDSTIVTDTQAQVQSYVSSMYSKLNSYKCDVYLSDASGNNIGAAGNATFGQYVCVDVSCNFDPVLPTFLKMSSSIPIRSQTIMASEAN